MAHSRDQCRWFGGMVGNHVADIVARYGAGGAAVPADLTAYIEGRTGYDYSQHGRAGSTHTVSRSWTHQWPESTPSNHAATFG